MTSRRETAQTSTPAFKHVLRSESTYLLTYSLIRDCAGFVRPVQMMHGDFWAVDSGLHLGHPEAFWDQFSLMQPCARLDDLLCAYLAPLRPDLATHGIKFAPRRAGGVSNGGRAKNC